LVVGCNVSGCVPIVDWTTCKRKHMLYNNYLKLNTIINQRVHLEYFVLKFKLALNNCISLHCSLAVLALFVMQRLVGSPAKWKQWHLNCGPISLVWVKITGRLYSGYICITVNASFVSRNKQTFGPSTLNARSHQGMGSTIVTLNIFFKHCESCWPSGSKTVIVI